MSSNPILHSDIRHICAEAQVGDFLCVRSPGKFGWSIRHLLSFGPHRAITNHNAPITEGAPDPRSLQIEAPVAFETSMVDYLVALYDRGGLAILVRPDVYRRGISAETKAYLSNHWKSLAGAPYDTPSIRMILRRYLRYAPQLAQNDKEKIYCTEGTFIPYADAPQPWTPDELKNESYPAPIHAENMIREGVAVYVAGSRELISNIIRQIAPPSPRGICGAGIPACHSGDKQAGMPAPRGNCEAGIPACHPNGENAFLPA